MNLDLGCGSRKREGYLGVDVSAFPGVDFQVNLGRDIWPWADGSVKKVHCSHFLEHLTSTERIHFVNELYRVLAVGGICDVITPNWRSERAYGDLTHQWPPVCLMWYSYLSASWRQEFAPHNGGYTCDFMYAGRETDDDIIVVIVKTAK